MKDELTREEFYKQIIIKKNFFPVGEATFHKWLTHGPNIYQINQLLKSISLCGEKRITAIDIGANVGLQTRILSSCFENVLAFEPTSKNRACIYRNIPPGNNNVTIYPYALGNEENSAWINIHSENCGAQTLKDISKSEDPRFNDKELVQIKKLDSILAGITKTSEISLIKIDVQGYELEVLQGAANIITKNKPIILCELESRNESNKDSIRRMMNELSYTLKWKYAKDGIFVSR